uniref:Uncharacterized protein n=1 Tax=Arundo donax TaxID=35708 RepID=A0A0A9BXA5_ARUDO
MNTKMLQETICFILSVLSNSLKLHLFNV